jgi:hypothetical protein
MTGTWGRGTFHSNQPCPKVVIAIDTTMGGADIFTTKMSPHSTWNILWSYMYEGLKTAVLYACSSK